MLQAPKQITMENPLCTPFDSKKETKEENNDDIDSCICCMYCCWCFPGIGAALF